MNSAIPMANAQIISKDIKSDIIYGLLTHTVSADVQCHVPVHSSFLADYWLVLLMPAGWPDAKYDH
jgi:hypothetical protein